MIPKQPLRFGLVGGAATLIHIGVGMALIWMGIPPLLANFLAFISALGVSFWGHHTYSFHGHSQGIFEAFQRFLLVAILAFSLNELSLVLLLATIPVLPEASLLLATVIAALFTFTLSKNWAFKGQPVASWAIGATMRGWRLAAGLLIKSSTKGGADSQKATIGRDGPIRTTKRAFYPKSHERGIKES